MKDKKQITVNMTEASLERLDALCRQMDMNRAQIVRTIFSDNEKIRRIIFDLLAKADVHAE